MLSCIWWSDLSWMCVSYSHGVLGFGGSFTLNVEILSKWRLVLFSEYKFLQRSLKAKSGDEIMGNKNERGFLKVLNLFDWYNWLFFNQGNPFLFLQDRWFLLMLCLLCIFHLVGFAYGGLNPKRLLLIFFPHALCSYSRMTRKKWCNCSIVLCGWC